MKKKEMKTKVMAVAMSATMAASICPAVPAMAVTKDQVAKDGTYTSTKHVTDEQEDGWSEYDVNVSVQVSGGKIAGIEVTPGATYDKESDSYFNWAKDGKTIKGVTYPGYTSLIGKAATEDTINNWDVVSKATCTSHAVKQAALAAIQSAPGASTAVTVDTSALEASITKAKVLKESDYTAETWSALKTALTSAETALADKKSQDAVDTAKRNLDSAIGNLKAVAKETYSYVYVGMTWAEYWANEGVYQAGNTASSNEKDSRGESDKGAFDVVTRATANHGLHRGSFQCIATIYDVEGNVYKLAGWKSQTELVLTDGSTVAFDSKNKIIAGKTFDHYEVSGLKYVPVKVKTLDLTSLKEKYTVVENGETMFGGFGEEKLSSYTEKANVTANTYGLKEAVKSGDGFTFTERKNEGTESGIKDQALKTATGVEPTVKDASGSYGEFLRVDINGNYGNLGANMQAVTWTYYGNDSTYSTPLRTFGTKFSSDNWMHKSMGIQLGLTDSLRCQLPEGTDGTGYWKLTVRALGYEDYVYKFEAKAENIVAKEQTATAEEIAALRAKVTEAEALNGSDYTAESWRNLQTELTESKDLLAKDKPTESEVKEQTTHLTDAINNLVKAEKDVYVLMNIPYDVFYKAETTNNDVKVDAFTSATKNKTRTGSLAGGSYHVNADGSDITGITYPVKVDSSVDLSKYKQVTDSDSVSITVTNRGKTTTTE